MKEGPRQATGGGGGGGQHKVHKSMDFLSDLNLDTSKGLVIIFSCSLDGLLATMLSP